METFLGEFPTWLEKAVVGGHIMITQLPLTVIAGAALIFPHLICTTTCNVGPVTSPILQVRKWKPARQLARADRAIQVTDGDF